MILGGFTVEEFDRGIDAQSNGFGQLGGVLSEQFFACCVMLVGSLSDDLQGGSRQAIDLGLIESDRTGTAHCIHHRIEDAVDDEDFFFGDAQQVVIVRGTLDDASGGQIQIGGFIDDHRWIAWSGDDGAFAAVEGSAGNGRSTRHADQSDLAMLEELLCRFECWLADQADAIVDPDFGSDRLVESAHTLGSYLASARVRIDHQGIPTGDHADGIAGDRRERVGHRGNRSDDAEGSVFDDGQAAISAVAFGSEEFDPGGLFTEGFELCDFVFKSSDLGFLHLHRSEFLALADRDTSDDVDDLFAVFDRSLLELLESGSSRGDCIVDVVEQTRVTAIWVGRTGPREVQSWACGLAAHLADDLFDDRTDEGFVDLHDP